MLEGKAEQRMHMFLQCKFTIHACHLTLFFHINRCEENFSRLIDAREKLITRAPHVPRALSQWQEQSGTKGQSVWINHAFTVLEESIVFPMHTNFVTAEHVQIYTTIILSSLRHCRLPNQMHTSLVIFFIYSFRNIFNKGITKIWNSDWWQKFYETSDLKYLAAGNFWGTHTSQMCSTEPNQYI